MKDFATNSLDENPKYTKEMSDIGGPRKKRSDQRR